jgi:hypothetical protein
MAMFTEPPVAYRATARAAYSSESALSHPTRPHARTRARTARICVTTAAGRDASPPQDTLLGRSA